MRAGAGREAVDKGCRVRGRGKGGSGAGHVQGDKQGLTSRQGAGWGCRQGRRQGMGREESRCGHWGR